MRLGQDDRDNAILKQRLAASKRARLEEVKGGSENEESNREEFAKATSAQQSDLVRNVSLVFGSGRAVEEIIALIAQ